MSLRQRAALASAAALCLLVALVLVVNAGLPERALFTGQVRQGERPIAPEIDAIAPSFTARTLDGKEIRLDDLRGSPVVINFWATWCGPCRVEMPELQALYAAQHDYGLRVLAINLGEPTPLVRQWVEEFGLTFDIVLDERGEIAASYFLRGQPSTYVISPEGVITRIDYGPTTQLALQSALEPYLTGKN